MHFQAMLKARQKAVNSVLCVGLDVSEQAAAAVVKEAFAPVSHEKFVRNVIDATHPYACAFKPNLAFYEASGHWGMEILKNIVRHIRAIDPRIPIIGDGKRTDIGATNNAYAEELFEHFGFDAVTVNPYFGGKSLEPFLQEKWKDKGIFVLCRTSNPGAGEFQDLYTLTKNPGDIPEGMCAEEWLEILKLGTMPLYRRVAWNVKSKWNKNGNCGLVVGATYPDELAMIRGIARSMTILVPGIGTQGGNIELVLGANSGGPIIVNVSSAITGASKGADYAEAAGNAAMQYRDTFNQHR